MVLNVPNSQLSASPSAELDTLSVLLLNLVQTPPASKCCSHSPSVSSVSTFDERLLPMQTSAFHRLLPAVEHRAHQTCLKSNRVRSTAWQVMKLPPTDNAWYRQAHDRQTPDREATSPSPVACCEWASELCIMIGFARRDSGAGSLHVIAPCNHVTGQKQKEKKTLHLLASIQ